MLFTAKTTCQICNDDFESISDDSIKEITMICKDVEEELLKKYVDHLLSEKHINSEKEIDRRRSVVLGSSSICGYCSEEVVRIYSASTQGELDDNPERTEKIIRGLEKSVIDEMLDHYRFDEDCLKLREREKQLNILIN